ncbi:hypothetical protein HanXRQr2_Chr17g0814021 [Helianthus annuus]|uniref:Uncharacterized protein n=1 Tax=Helianthus annuus TaxID=4232 RepID=A0A251RS98_HELAN|nr:hypothetical protein HanXRQr2_Chr17g0814021 [Helianthus annuus]
MTDEVSSVFTFVRRVSVRKSGDGRGAVMVLLMCKLQLRSRLECGSRFSLGSRPVSGSSSGRRQSTPVDISSGNRVRSLGFSNLYSCIISRNLHTQPLLMRTMLRNEVALMPRYTYRR